MSQDTHKITVEAYSDVALNGAISSLEKMQFRGIWGEKRLDALKAEKERRAAKRRADGKVGA